MVDNPPEVVFVTNFCTHYSKGTFDILSQSVQVTFYFYSAGKEWYWQAQHGTFSGHFKYEYLPGINIRKHRFTPTLFIKLFQRKYDVLISGINGRLILPFTFLISRIKGKPFILWTGIWTRLKTPFHRLFFPFIKYILVHADAIVVYGQHVKDYLVSEGCQPEKIFIAPHAVDNRFYSRPVNSSELDQLRAKLKLSLNQKVILYLGRFDKIKGLTYLVQGFKQIKRDDLVLVLAGTGEEEIRLRNLVHDENLEPNIRFTGYVPIEETLPYYRLADVFVLPSISLPRGKELWGLVINEAFNQGAPAITTEAVGAAADGFVKDGYNGFVVQEKDPVGISAALAKIVDNNSLRQEFSINALKSVSQRDQAQMAGGFIRAISYVLEQKKKNEDLTCS
jgi:glycosyltransferase involved in cell wall biosynthesis